MAYYLVTAEPKPGQETKLIKALEAKEFSALEPFGEALTYSLEHAKRDDDGRWVWEELDYCNPPLKQERSRVLDRFFAYLDIEKVDKGEGWNKIVNLPKAHEIVSS